MIVKKNIKNEEKFEDYLKREALSYTEILISLARNIRIILVTPTVFCVLTILYVQFFAKPLFRSDCKVMSSSSANRTQIPGIVSQLGINFSPNQNQEKWIYPEIIKSRVLARAMLKKKFDTKEFGPQKSLLQILTFGNKQPLKKLETLELIGINNFIKLIELDVDEKTGIYTVGFSGYEPGFVKDLTFTLVKELDRHQKDYNKEKTGKTKLFIKERIDDTKKELNHAEDKLKTFTDRNRRIENSPSLQLERERLAREVNVLTGVFTTLKQQLETAKIEEVKEADYVIIIDPPEVSLYPYWPKKKNMVIIAGFIGIATGILIGFFVDRMKKIDDNERMELQRAKKYFNANIFNS